MKGLPVGVFLIGVTEYDASTHIITASGINPLLSLGYTKANSMLIGEKLSTVRQIGFSGKFAKKLAGGSAQDIGIKLTG